MPGGKFKPMMANILLVNTKYLAWNVNGLKSSFLNVKLYSKFKGKLKLYVYCIALLIAQLNNSPREI